MIAWYNSGNKSAHAMLGTSVSVARISQRLRRTDSDMPNDNTPAIPLTKEIPLSRGKVAIIDADDYERVCVLTWCANKNLQGRWYAKTTVKGKTIQLHRLILNITDPKVSIDHIDGNGLNNQRSNLRIATAAQNCMNTGPYKNNISGFKGVSWSTEYGMWRAIIGINRKRLHIGRFRSAEDAARAYDAKAIELHGEFAWLNFPQEKSK